MESAADSDITVDRDVLMTTRDGTRLLSDVYRPDDGSAHPVLSGCDVNDGLARTGGALELGFMSFWALSTAADALDRMPASAERERLTALVRDLPVDDRYAMIAGPWTHRSAYGGDSGVRDWSLTAPGGPAGHTPRLLEWFDRWLLDAADPSPTRQPAAERDVTPRVRWFATGDEVRREARTWPPEGDELTLHLGAGAVLSPMPVANDGWDRVRHDPTECRIAAPWNAAPTSRSTPARRWWTRCRSPATCGSSSLSAWARKTPTSWPSSWTSHRKACASRSPRALRGCATARAPPARRGSGEQLPAVERQQRHPGGPRVRRRRRPV